MSARPIAAMRNLGPAMARMLGSIGVRDEAGLRALGAAEAFARLRATTDHRVSLNALYAMQAALLDRDWRSLDAATKAALRQAAGEGVRGRRSRRATRPDAE